MDIERRVVARRRPADSKVLCLRCSSFGDGENVGEG